MIGSFWNLCRACPSMPVDKLHSEYRSTYRWHEYTGGSRPEVIRRPPVQNQFASSTDHFFSKSTEDDRNGVHEGTCNEPPLPRRKKCPELAYKTHEFINGDVPAAGVPSSTFRNHVNQVNRARGESRAVVPSRRSKSEGPHRMVNGDATKLAVANQDRIDAAIERGFPGQAGESSSGLLKKTIHKLSTEYRLQFVWPNPRTKANTIKSIDRGYDAVDTSSTADSPRKSLSTGALRAARGPAGILSANAMPTVHKKRTIHRHEATVQELEPLVTENEKPEKTATQRRHVRPLSEYGEKAGHTERENYGFEAEKDKTAVPVSKAIANSVESNASSWYKDVIELRKKAGEYKCRGWGVEIQPDILNNQKELWNQVSRRSSLSALSLASTTARPISKEEKEQENNKKSSPTKANQVHFVDDNKMCDNVTNRLYSVRHHLERTTGPDVEEGALLPSPTREKLMPTTPKNDESYNSQRGSPKKSASSRHGSPQKGSPQKSPKKVAKQTTKGGRSQSVGPTGTNVDGSPKRQARSGSAVPGTVVNVSTKPPTKKTSASTPSTIIERRPRPTTLSTSTNSRSKSSSVPPIGRSHTPSSAIATNPKSNTTTTHIPPTPNNNTQTHNGLHEPQSQTQPPNGVHTTTKLSPSNLSIPNLKKSYRSSPNSASPSPITTTTNNKTPNHQRPVKSALANGHKDPMTESTMFIGDGPAKRPSAQHDDDTDKDVGSVSSASPLPTHEIIEHIVKSPPEPTRVKSPEQIIMRSPDPVNWTVPLDTGKTFTVTQNVRDGMLGEPIIRPHSEFKASTPVDKPPPAPMSAPPELAEHAKTEAPTPSNTTNHTTVTVNDQPLSSFQPQQLHPSAKLPNAAGAGAVTTQSTINAGGADAFTKPEPIRYDKPVPGSTLRCLDDPTFDQQPISAAGANAANASAAAAAAAQSRTMAAEVLEKARDRFDRFWGGSKEENV